MKLENFYEDRTALHVGTMDNRCYYVPLGADGRSRSRFLSRKEWDFAYYPCVEEVPENFPRADFAAKGFVKMEVPSCWQSHGYGQKQYTNVRYPFPFDPPYVPDDNPCGAYITQFHLDQDEAAMRRFLYFEGVDSCFYVWVNGEFAGYSQVSHSSSEFEITGKTHEGENRLSVLVLQWCDGSYLEDQDKFRFSGIFRDVSLIMRPNSFLHDFTVTTPVDLERGTAAVEVRFDRLEGKPKIFCELLDARGKLVGTAQTSGEPVHVPVKSPVLWNAEQPYLYILKLSTKEEQIVRKIGIRCISVKDGVIYINGKQVKFKGVNRHDSHPGKGYAVSVEDVMKDLALMKEHNINAIRTSHYPNAPWFPELCSEYGFYLIAEADMECHGVISINRNKREPVFGLIAEDSDWRQSILDRQERNVIRDKNECSIIFWSLGNESGYGSNFEEAGRWVKAYDPTRLVHYEGSNWEAPGRHNDTSMLDVKSRMYAPVDWIKAYCEDKEREKPFIQCEFVHAMGNGPGDIHDYMELMYRYDKFCGGFVWEWCDHATYEGTAEDGRDIYHYGGDAGEYPHDGNFCMDGLVYPDRRPHTGLLEYKNEIRPLVAESLDPETGILVIRNRLDFMELSDAAKIYYEIKCDGETVETGQLPSMRAEPHETAQFFIPTLRFWRRPRTWIRLYYVQKTDAALTEAGRIMGFDQFALFEEEWELPLSMPDEPCGENALSLQEDEKDYIISSGRIEYRFGKKKAGFVAMKKDGREILEGPMTWTVFRAPVDNDRNIRSAWERAGYDRPNTKVYSCKAYCSGRSAIITCEFSLAGIYREPFLHGAAVWEVAADGTVKLTVDAVRDKDLTYLPRFGIVLTLPAAESQVEYLGYGPYESYQDKHRASWMDRFKTTVEELHEDYVKPQENGSHWNCHEVRVGSLKAMGKKPFSFNASYYTAEELASKAHNYELEKSGHVILHLDYAMSGVGSNSCGPELLEKYRLKEEKMHWEMMLSIL